MKFGVKINKKGEIDITDPNLIRYRDILNSLLSCAVSRYMIGVKYPSSQWNIFEDKDFMGIFENELEKCIEFLVENNIFPVDILTPRPPISKVVDVIRLDGTNIYGAKVETKAFGSLIIPPYNSLLEAVKSIGVVTWTLIEKPYERFVYLGKSRGKKLSQKEAELLWERVKKSNEIEMQISCFSKYRIKETGIKVILNTKDLGQYSCLKYALETL
jgi:hypothetical protein